MTFSDIPLNELAGRLALKLRAENGIDAARGVRIMVTAGHENSNVKLVVRDNVDVHIHRITNDGVELSPGQSAFLRGPEGPCTLRGSGTAFVVSAR